MTRSNYRRGIRTRFKPKYTPEIMRGAVALYEVLGPREAGRRTGITPSTIGRWARAAGVEPMTVQTSNRAANGRAVAEERRQTLSDARLARRRDLLKQMDSATSSKEVLRLMMLL